MMELVFATRPLFKALYAYLMIQFVHGFTWSSLGCFESGSHARVQGDLEFTASLLPQLSDLGYYNELSEDDY